MKKGSHFIRKKETKVRALKKTCGKSLFIEKFGKPIEEFESYKRAVESVNKRSERSYCRVLPAFFLFLGENPDQVISNRKSDIMSSDVLDNERYERKTKAYIKDLISKDLVVSGHLGRIRGFFSNNSQRLSLNLRHFKYPKARKRRKYSPSLEDVRQLINFADSKRDRFIVSVAFHNGALPIDISGLKIGEYPQEPWQHFVKSRSKTGEIWQGVSTPDTCTYLKDYMVNRQGKINDPLLLGREGPLDSEGISQVIRSLIERAGLSGVPGFVPKCLRDGFEDALTDAELPHKVKESLMGHVSGIQFEYGSEAKMRTRLIEAMKKVYPFISLSEGNVDFSLSGLLSVEDLSKVKEIIKNIDVYRELSSWLKNNELYHINDPELHKRLKNKDANT